MYQHPDPHVPPPPYAAAPPSPPKKKTGKVVAVVVAVVLLLCCGGCGLFLALKPDAVAGFVKGFAEAANSNLARAEAGDCVNAFTKPENAKVVDCASAEAANKVVGVIEGVSETRFDTRRDTLCDAYPTWETVVWIGRKTDGDAWCMEPIKK